MQDLEKNKILAAILLASLIAMLVGFVTNLLYKPDLEVKKSGYNIDISHLEDGTDMNSSADEPLDIEALMAKANAENGAKVAKKCVSCHSFDKGGANKIGPNLWNIVGAKKAAKDGFNYSKALTQLGGEWDIESLVQLLHKPSKYIPGTKMSFVGLRDYEDIADMIAYLKQQSD